jgi:hypothetical protein
MEKALELIMNELVEQNKQGFIGDHAAAPSWSKGYDAGWARGMEHAISTLRTAIEDGE